MFRSLRLLSLSVATLTLMASSAYAAQKEVGLITGASAGTYYQIGKDIAAVAKKEGVPLVLRESTGSVDNLQKMATTGENAALGIVQSDVLSFLVRSKMPKSQEIAHKLRLVMPLFKEEVHLLARNDIARIGDLQGKRVVIGKSGSGSMMTATNLLTQLQITPKQMFETSPAEAIVAVLANRADAMIFVGGKPVPMFKNLQKLAESQDSKMVELVKQVHLVPILPSKATRLYEGSLISPQDYPFVTEEVPTLAVRAVLVSYDFTLKDTPYYKERCKQLFELGRALTRALPELQHSGHQKWEEVDANRELPLWKRDSCAWPGVKTMLTAPDQRYLPQPISKPAFGMQSPAVVPEHSAFEDELLGIIVGK
jgi:TRAP transporter TAXI family solute receptor